MALISTATGVRSGRLTYLAKLGGGSGSAVTTDSRRRLVDHVAQRGGQTTSPADRSGLPAQDRYLS